MKKNIVIVVLVLIIIIMGGSLFYLNMNKDKVNNKCKVEEKEETKNENLLTQEEALSLGKEKYEYARDGLYSCGYTQVKIDESKFYTYTLDGMKTTGDSSDYYARITNINDIKSNLTFHGFIDWVIYMDIKTFNNEFYFNSMGCGEGPVHAKDNYEISVLKIYKDMIIYNVKEKFYKINNSDVSDEIDENSTVENRFVILKEDNVWKINEYTDYYAE